MRELVVHVGLPKTATTTIQLLLAAHADELLAAGVGTRAAEGGAVHHALGDALLTLDAQEMPSRYHDTTSTLEDLWPRWGDEPRFLLSAENLVTVRSNGVEAVERFASRHDATITLVLAVRQPIQWAWSLWTQAIKMRPVGWMDLVRECIETPWWLTSSVIAPWLASDRVRAVEILDHRAEDHVVDFLDRFAAPGIIDRNLIDGLRENSGGGIATSMYGAALHIAAAERVRHDRRFRGIDVDEGYVQRYAVSIFTRIAPASETAFRFADVLEGLRGTDGSPTGPDSIPLLERLAIMGRDDARAVLASADPRISSRSREALANHANEIDVELDRLASGAADWDFPREAFAELLPIDARFLETVRLLAAAMAAALELDDRTRRNEASRHRS